ncbi:putative RWD, RING finger and WD repeat-containing protein [Lasiodiplodia theobromae]|uniref:Putative RWD, RING finger and WD repeat-containing protein n=1 Tax=Lasiodiplodia theobromae TaxID=45133 RepID=A0A5N5DDD9_9PEZI|nr:putative RWD, RING finger and WD repeat-containing protein [Lasiodiplodia theobromae]
MHPHGDSSPFDSPTFGRDASIRVDEPVGSASISPSSRDIVLASREGLHIIDLDNPYSPPRHLAHRTLWEVADVQWSPFASHDGLVASTSNQKALIWDLNHANHPPLTLHAHSRAITDINLSAHHPDILATCAVDTFVHKWDLRTPDRPVFSYAQWDGGAAQVKWNRQDPHILASAHDKLLCIWDERKGVEPLRTIEAHRSKIYGVDWNRMRQGGVLTCSLDGSIKFWDYTRDEDEMLERVIRTPFGVWRARHTPFGWGALAMPQRGDFDLHLYDRRLRDGVKRDAKVPPVHTFKGHNGQVKEFLWRTRGDVTDDGYDQREFQLVSWGSDRQLNLYRIDSSILGSVGYKKGEHTRKKLFMTRQGALYKTFHDEAPVLSPKTKVADQQQAHPFTAPSQLSALFQSAGMSKPSLPYAQTAFQGPGASARDRGLTSMQARGLTTMQARTREKKTVDKLTWMQGVKIGGRDGQFNRHGSRPDVLSPDQQLLWDSPESLGDEITHVGSKFKKVKFEEVEIPRRTATVTLNGPWGENEAPVFMRISIRFPPDYPVSATPHCSIEKTTSYISESTISKLDSEIKALAEVYKNRKRGSLDAIISYLLGERGLEESISWLSDGALTDSGVTQDEESSSDEEDEVGADFATPAMEMSGTDILGPLNANANVPLPRQCGAVWSRDGRLVTFFPPKPEPKPMFSNLEALRNDSRTYKSKRIFEMLGQLNKESPDPGRKSSSAVDNPDDSDSQGSWETSSSSSSGSPVRGGLSGIAPPVAWRGGPLKFQRSSQHSSAGYEVKPIAPKPKSIITIRNLEDLLPAKRELAERYEIFGEASDVCSHNAAVATDCGYSELADIWNLVGLILADQVPLEVMQQSYRREPILVVAKRTAVQIRKKDSGLDLSFDEPEAIAKPKLKSRVKWGYHPFGRTVNEPQQQQRFVSFDSIDELGTDEPDFDDDEDFYPNFEDDKTDIAPIDRNPGGSVIQVTLKNQDQFDDDGYLSVPLLNQELGWMYAAYRANYANNELAGWGLQIKRSEVLKYNGLTSYWIKDEVEEAREEDLAVGRSQESIGARSSTIVPDDLVLCPLPLPPLSDPPTTSTTARSSVTHTRAHTPDPSHLLQLAASAGTNNHTSSNAASQQQHTAAANSHHYHLHNPFFTYHSHTPYATHPTTTPLPTRPPSIKSGSTDSPPNEKAATNEHDGAFGGGWLPSATTTTTTATAFGAGGANGVGHGAAGNSSAGISKVRTCMVCWLQLDGLYRTCAECGHAVHAECGGEPAASGLLDGHGEAGVVCWYCGG